LTSTDANTRLIRLNSVDGIYPGAELLIIQMKAGSDVTSAGRYEFQYVATVSSDARQITLVNGTKYSYSHGMDGAVTQILLVKHYQNVTLNNDLFVPEWNGTVGGLIAFKVKGSLTGTGSINANGRGYRGGQGGNYDISPRSMGYFGESYSNWLNQTVNQQRNHSAGGGGRGDNKSNCGSGTCGGGGGGGGANLTNGVGGAVGIGSMAGGQAGAQRSWWLGTFKPDSRIIMGSGGGGGGSDEGISAGNGGAGGAAVFISAQSISIDSIKVNGSAGQNSVVADKNRHGGGGGGAGGSVYIRAGIISRLDSIEANGGAGGIGNNSGGNGGSGGIGDILVQYCDSTVNIGGTANTVEKINCLSKSSSSQKLDSSWQTRFSTTPTVTAQYTPTMTSTLSR
jgi:hypothetical protein